MRVRCVHIGRPRLLVHAGKRYSSAIDKRAVEGPVRLGPTGFDGDRQADARNHGGPEQADCAFPAEHYPAAEQLLGVTLVAPAFGENLTTEGLLEHETRIGDVLRIGEAIAQVSKPRQPCFKLARKHRSPDLVEWIIRTARCGFYLRVIEPGCVRSGDPIRLIDRPRSPLTVAEALRAMLDPDATERLIRRAADCEHLSPDWRRRLRRRLEAANEPPVG